MWKRRLGAPLSAAALRRTLAAAGRAVVPTHSASQGLRRLAERRAVPPSSDAGTAGFPPLDRRDFLRRSGRSCCSGGAPGGAAPECWNCGAGARETATAPFLVCESCRSVQPVDESVDYFRIFELEKKYEMDVTNLEGKYKAWQKKLHPDLVHSKSEQEKEYAAGQSARVIDAYRTLSKPLTRAIYVLKLEGVNVDEEETVSEPELLTEILEIREAVDEAADSQALKQIQSQFIMFPEI
ncbi:iron-sulfur cluster co-chaperone protein HscB homolog isoform X2 [Syzygium oleosum]|uniref:iron-sulfur cluster co-chaperone protein HscB homolog isoform X2 n=1 Tax=Syzygium oleosum TaxID=219896 RepID=UPI0024BBD39B|nr:iron-sulfur cluster co-chaperone protein HscB homolog isoform X2 [Syzygium oleosum]